MSIQDRSPHELTGETLHLSAPSDGPWIMPGKVALFTADFSREHFDLVLTTEDGLHVRLDNYFVTDDLPDLLSHDGATLSGGVVARLAGPLFPGQYAQAGGDNLAAAIGQVETLVGAAFVQRTDGQVDDLQVGTKVFQGDVVRTENGGTLGLTFADGTIFTLASGSRMVLDELIYDPQANDNSGVFNLVEGSFVFIAGQTAKTGGIEITTPAATMGIRGTTGKIDIVTFNGVATVTVSLNPDPDGGLGAIELFDLNGNLITTITGTETKWIIRPPFTGEPPIEVERTSIELGEDAPLLSQAIAAFESAVTRVRQGETFVELPEGDGDAQDDAPSPQPPDDEAPEDAQPPRPAPLDDVGNGDGDAGESGSGNPELDGNDEPVLDPEAGPNPDDDAQLDPGPTGQGTDFANAGGGIEFSDLQVQIVEDNALTTPLPIRSRTGEAVPVTLARAAANGEVVLSTDGSFTYTPNPDFEGTDTFVVSGLDQNGQVQESVITVVVDPVNDAPSVIQRLAAATISEDGADTPAGSGSATGTLSYVDVDEGDTPGVWSIAAAPENATAFGTIRIDAATGVWTYDLDQAAADALTDDQAFDETFVATITDAQGSTDVSTLVITVTGTNDSPVITANVDQTQASLATGPGTAQITDPQVVTTGSVSGELTYTDVDEGTTSATWTIAAAPLNETAFGTIGIDAATGVWTYQLPTDEPIPLNNGETVVEVFTATVTDAGGATAQQAITIAITGTNDAPTIVFSIEDVTATVVEDGFVTTFADRSASFAAPVFDAAEETTSFSRISRSEQSESGAGSNASGTLRYTDTDGQSGAASWRVEPDSASLGTMTIDSVTGQWHYFLDQEAANSLRQGDEVIETFIATVTDPFGGHASQVITITVQGTNDAAGFSNRPQDLVGSVAEGGVATATGRLTFSDPDALPGEQAAWSIAANGKSRGVMDIDTLTGQWTYALDPVAAQSLSASGPVTETYTATLTDSFGATADQTITITLTGENDAPVLATGSATLAKSTASIAIDLIALGSDVDDGESGATLVYQIASPPGEGSATLSGGDLIFATNGDFDDLSAGESRDVTVGITATDGFGATTTGTVVITVTGSNTGPVITSGPSAAQGTTTEAGAAGPGTAQVQGALSYIDDDAATPTSGIWSVVPRSVAFGSMGIDATTGEWIYTLNNAAADQLNEGATAQDIFRATITDADGQAATQDITITITGSNDTPGLTAATATVLKDQASFILDLATFGTDPDGEDTGATLAYDLDSGPGAGNGTASVSGGLLTFGTNGDFDDLLAGQSQDVVVRIGVTDAQGLRSVSDVTITVTGSSSAPVITSGATEAQGDVTESGAATPGTLTASGTLSYDDPDAATPTSGTWTLTPDTSALGFINIDAATGVWTYGLDDAAANSLNEGETLQEFFTATITDADGLTDSQVITITITGSNDAPTLDADSTTITKDTANVDFDLSALAADPDLADTPGTLTFTIESAPRFGLASLSGSDLSFSTETGFDDLGPGDTRVDTVDVRVTDGSGAFAISTFTITVTGSNAAPQITSAATAAQGDVTEAGVDQPNNGTLADATGQLTYADADERPGFEGAWSVAPGSAAPFGQMNITTDTGAWSYFLDEDRADSLREGDTATDTFIATITDEFGATDTQVMTITITGTNDAPVVDIATSNADGTVTSGGPNSVSGQINFDDADDVVAAAVWSIAADTSTTPAFGSMSIDAAGAWTYAVNAAAVAALPSGESRTETYIATVTDEFGASDDIAVVITIDGSNASPVITSPASAAEGDVVESGDTASTNLQTSGQLTYDDPDETLQPAEWSIQPITTPTLGTISIAPASGLWTYTLNDTAADALNAGDTVVEQFRATVTDTNGGTATQIVAITITGTNDSPTLTQSGVTTVAEDGSTTLDLRLFAADVDANDTVSDLTFTIASLPARGIASITDGVLSFDTNGAFDDLMLDQTEDVTINVTVSDGNGGAATSAITLQVTGSNDAPVIDLAGSVFTGTITEDGNITPPPDTSVSGTLVYTDADEPVGASASWRITPDITAFGSITIGAATGIWEYTLDQSAADALQAGQSVTETFTATVEDTDGATDSQTITVTITGTNDAPTLTQITTPVLGQDAIGFIDLSALSADVDTPATDLSWAIGPGTFKGNATITDTALRFDPNGEFDSLAAEETEDVTINIIVSDGAGGQTTSPVTIRVSGANDAPVITSSDTAAQGSITENGDTAPTPPTSVGGTLTYSDSDEAPRTPANWSIDPFTPALGTLAIGATTGVWEYTLDQSAADILNAGEIRTETFAARVTDAQGASDTQTITVTITGTNDVPTLAAGTLDAVEDGGAAILDLATLADDADANNSGANLTYSTTSTLAGLSITDNIMSFDPGTGFQTLAAGETQDFAVTVQAEDVLGATFSNTVNITVTGTNDLPTVPDFFDTVTESGTVFLDIDGAGSDIDNGASLAYAVITVPTKGFTQFLGTTVIFRTNGAFETLAAGQTEDVIVGYRARDDQGAFSEEGLITFTVIGQNDAPALAAGALAATEDGGPVTLDLTTLGNDVDNGENGSTLIYALDGAVTGADVNDGILTFDPGTDFQNLAAGQTADVSVDITATDSGGLEARSTVTVTVTGTNDDPTFAAGTMAVTEDGAAVTLDLSTLAADPDDGSTLTYALDLPTGTTSIPGVTLTGADLTYDPGNRFDGLALGETTDIILNVSVSDQEFATTDSTVTVTVTGTNDAPVLLTDLGTVGAAESDEAFTINVPAYFTSGGRAIDPDSDDDASTLSYLFSNASTANFSVTATDVRLNIAGNYDDLAVGEQATETIDVMATDRHGATSNVGTLTWTVTGENDNPTLAAGTLAATEDGTVAELDLATLASDPDISDRPDLTYRLIAPPPEATISETTLAFDPGAGFQNLAAGDTRNIDLTVEVDDNNGGTATNIVTVTVTGVNDTAVFADGTATVGERDGTTFIDLSGLVSDADDGQDGTNKTYQIVSGPTPGNGTAVIDGLGVQFDPNGDFDDLLAGQTRDISFTVQAVDAGGGGDTSNTATITVTVTGVNNPPEAQDFTVSHDGDAGALSIDALAQVLDDDDTAITLVSVSAPGAGNAVIDDMGTADLSDDVILYTPDLLTNGSPDSFTYTVEDSAGNQDTGTITVNVPENTAPFANDASVGVTLESRAGMTFSADTNGYYEFVRGYYTWADAQAAAAAQGGHLATIFTADENQTVFELVSGAGGDIDGWLGASDAAVEGEWRWVDGPETGQQFWQGDQTGSLIPGQFESWAEGQPSFLDAAANDYLSIRRSGEGGWDDVLGSDPRGYVLEKSGLTVGGSISGSVIHLDGGDPLTFTLDTAIEGLNFTASGFYTFDPNTDAYAYLADGETLVINANYTATDERGASDTAAFTLTITGDNDAPTVVDDSASVTAALPDAGPSGGGWTEWTVASGGNGHFYKYVSGSFEWVDARANAAAQNGHLATVTSLAERNFIGTLSGGFQTGWLGGSDAGDTGNWRWVEGPETGQQFSNFSTPVNGSYTTWNVSEPNDSADPYLHFYNNGNWGDLGPGHVLGYYAEHSTVLPATGSVATNDSDAEGDTITYALSGSYDGLSMAADGSWTFDRTDAAYQDLEDGEIRIINAYYTATDALGASSDGRLQIEVTGINNPPVVVDESDDIVVNVGTAPVNPNWSTSLANGHLYEWVSANVSYADAVAAAQALGGHLATITDQAEQDFVSGLQPGGEFAYLGGSDAAVEGEWRWTAGPEDGEQFWQGDRTGTVSGDAYAFWNVNDPDPATANGEDALVMLSDGRWSDVADTTTTSYVVEYSKVPLVRGDVSLNDTDADGQPLSYVQNGSVAGFTLNADGSWTFDANNAAYAGITTSTPQTVTVTYTATDTQGGSASGTLSLNLTSENAAPVLGPDTEEITLINDPGPTGGGWVQWTDASGGNGHYYQIVAFSGDWASARADAATRGGHLATITSAEEQTFINTLMGPTAVGWLGGSDEAVEGDWRWVDGPETGQQFWTGATSGSTVGGSYANWNTNAGGQPNAGAEDALHTFGDGTWNNLLATDSLSAYYLEYSGLPLLTGSIAGNDSDPDGDTITYTPTNTVDGLTLNTDGSWTFDQSNPAYTPIAAGVIETFSLEYTATDGNGGSTNGTFDLDITGTNDAPVLTQTAVAYGSFAETAPIQFLDLLTAASDPDIGDTLEVRNFTYFWSSDIPGTPVVSPNASGILELDPADLTALNSVQSATLNMAYDISDGTINVARTATITITGVTTPVVANDDNLSPTDTPNVDEDSTLTVLFSTIQANDDDPESIGPTVVGFSEFIPGETRAFSEQGAGLFLSGSSFFVNPTYSAAANDLALGQTLVDQFEYTIQGSGVQTSTATIRYVIEGTAPHADLAPEAFASTGTGFTSGASDAYTINPLFLRDADEMTGMSYKFGSGTIDGVLPDYLRFNYGTGVLSVDQAEFVPAAAGVTDLFFSGFEADGQYAASPFSVVIDATGDIQYTLYGFNDTYDLPNLLEFGVDDTESFGNAGEDILVDLSGIDGITPAALEDLQVLDVSNGQKNTLIIDSDDLLNLIEGNTAGTNEEIAISADSFDDISFEDTTDWTVLITNGGTTAEITGNANDFAGLGLFATLDLDGATYPPS